MPLPLFSNTIITGGSFTLTNNNNITTNALSHYHDRLVEAVAHSAFHNSGARYNVPRCQPDTRVAIMDRLDRWRRRSDVDARLLPILWLTGAASAGKSAIAQSWAESCHERGFLLASFFFGRSDRLRNVATYLVATIVYQIYLLVPTEAQARILNVIRKDPLIFKRSIFTQFESLIVEPLLEVKKNNHFTQLNIPNVIILDGLDECLDTCMQINILEAVTRVLQTFNPPFIFLIASRPEQDIRAFLGTGQVEALISCLVLDYEHDPDQDIMTFLLYEFRECSKSHPFRHLIPSSWPSTEAIHHLIEKSSGQFIYAAVVVKYVTSARRNPVRSLDVILGLRPVTGISPFAELDALYSHIPSRVEDLETVLRLFNFILPKTPPLPFPWTASGLELIFGLENGVMHILFCDLHSLMEIENDGVFDIMHASLADFLHNPFRSGTLYIHTQDRLEYNCSICLNFLYSTDCEPNQGALTLCLHDLVKMLQELHSVQTPSLMDALMSFFIPPFFIPRRPGMILATLEPNTVPNVDAEESTHGRASIATFFTLFLTPFLEFVDRLKCQSTRHIGQHISRTMIEFWRQITTTFHDMGHDVNFRLALLTLSGDTSNILGLPLNWTDFTEYNWIEDVYDRLRRTDSSAIKLPEFEFLLNQCLYNSLKKVYSVYLSDLHERSCTLEREIFAQGAQYCLEQLCIRAPQTAAPRIITERCRLRRVHLPWKWNNRVIKEYVGDHKETPWMWLQFQVPTFEDFKYILHSKRRKIVYTTKRFRSSEEPRILYNWIRQWMEMYHLWMLYLPLLLQRAGKSESLLLLCQHKRFPEMSQEFPRASRKAHRAMAAYVERWT